MRRHCAIFAVVAGVAAVLIYLNLTPHDPGHVTGSGGLASDHDEYPVYGVFGLAFVVTVAGYFWMRRRLARVPDRRSPSANDHTAQEDD